MDYNITHIYFIEKKVPKIPSLLKAPKIYLLLLFKQLFKYYN